jgi:hypothetical protein
MAMLDSTSPSRNFLTSAPPQKNLSLALRTITARASLDGLVDGVREGSHDLAVVEVRGQVVQGDEPDRALRGERHGHQASPPTTTLLSST